MSAGPAPISLYEPRVAREAASSPGFSSPNRKFTCGEKLTITPKTTGTKLQVAGELGYRENIPEEESCDPITWQLKMCHRQFGFMAAMLFGQAAVTTGDSGISNPYDTGSFRHLWVVPANLAYKPQLYSIQAGVRFGGAYDDVIQQVQGAAFHSLKINAKRSESSGNVSGEITGFSKLLQPTSPTNQFAGADNATMTLDLSGASAGNLGWTNPANGEKVTFIYTATSATIQTALLTIYGGGNVTVVDGTGSHVHTVTFVGGLANTRIALPVLDLTGLTGTGTVAYVADSDNHLLRGEVGEWDFLPMLPNRFDVFLGTNMSDPFNTANKLSDEFATMVDFGNLFRKKFVQDSAQTSYKDIVFNGVNDGRKQSVDLTMQFDRTSIGFLDAWRNVTNLMFGLKCVSPVMVAGATPFSFKLWGKMGIDSYSQGEENEGVVSTKLVGDLNVNPDMAAQMFALEIISDIPNYYRTI